MEGILDHFIKNRLKELAIENHHLDWKKTKVLANQSQIIAANNELLFLFDVSPMGNFQIDSDTEIITEDDFFTDSAPYRLFEFSGDITIKNNSAEIQSYSFFRIIPA